jgi:hypothetical protein
MNLWILVSRRRLHREQEDVISWNLTPNGSYTAAAAYKPNLLAALKHQSSLLSGKLGHLQSANFSHGSSFRTIGLQTG